MEPRVDRATAFTAPAAANLAAAFRTEQSPGRRRPHDWNATLAIVSWDGRPVTPLAITQSPARARSLRHWS
jgi:hypothetical protein